MKSSNFLTMLIIAAMLIAPFSLGAAAPAKAATPLLCYVNGGALGANDGTSWDNAFTSLQSALNVASGCTEIWVAAGLYTPSAGGLSQAAYTFALRSGVAIYGGFQGVAGETVATRPMDTTYLSGDIDGDDTGFTINGVNSLHVVTASGTDNTAVLDGFTIVGGNANGLAYPDNDGGGMFIDTGSPTLANLTIQGNYAVNAGAGMFVTASNPSLDSVTFDSNTSHGDGGGLYAFQSSPSLTVVTFSLNTATNMGGGMYLASGSPTMANDTFLQNTALYGGGLAVADASSAPSLSSPLFNKNGATYGGGLYVYQGAPVLTNATFDTNTASSNGGGILNDSGSFSLDSAYFLSNSATGTGGGIYNANANPTINLTTFSLNTAANGAGMYTLSGSPTLTDPDFEGNVATGSGGGLMSELGSPVIVRGTFGTNGAGVGGGVYLFGGAGSLTDSVFTLNTAGSGAGMYSAQDSSDLSKVTFDRNTATNNGGGFYNQNNGGTAAVVTLTNVTFSGNGAVLGGGMYNIGDSQLTNVTFGGNTASGSAFGGGNSIYTTTSMHVDNSILWGSGPAAELAAETGILPFVADSIVRGDCDPANTNCTNIITVDPVLSALNYAAGPTPIFTLAFHSSAIDMGNNGTCAAIDQRNAVRPRDGNADGVAVCDIGSFELKPMSYWLPQIFR